MATAEEFQPAAELSTPKSAIPKRLFSAAALLAAIFAAAAFVFLVIRDHGHARIMVNDQTAPARKAGIATLSHDPAHGASSLSAGSVNSETKSFSLTKSKRTTQLGPVRVRLLRADSKQGVFDMSVLVGRRSHSHRQLKANEPIWIAANRGAAIQVVITAITDEGIAGHWQQSSSSSQVSTRAGTAKTAPKDQAK